MLHVILQILAVIGIILLCILGLLLLLIALVLFVPVRYRVKGEKDAEKLLLVVKATYLLHLVTVKFQYPEPGKAVVRIFGHKVAEFPSEETETPAEENATKSEPVKTEAKAETKAESAEQKTETVTEMTADTEAQSGSTADTTVSEPVAIKETAKEEAPKKRGFHPILWIKEKIHKCIYTIRSIYDKIKHIWDNLSYYKGVITREENQLFFGRVKTRLFKIFKSIKPRVMKAELLVGTGSPDTTGYLLGLHGMLYPVLGDHVNITPDFENAVLEGHFFIKGKITVFVLLVHAGGIYFDKQLRRFMKELKREEL